MNKKGQMVVCRYCIAQFEERKVEDSISTIEGALCCILDLLED